MGRKRNGQNLDATDGRPPDAPKQTLIDPACGSGSFLLGYVQLHQMHAELGQETNESFSRLLMKQVHSRLSNPDSKALANEAAKRLSAMGDEIPESESLLTRVFASRPGVDFDVQRLEHYSNEEIAELLGQELKPRSPRTRWLILHASLRLCQKPRK